MAWQAMLQPEYPKDVQKNEFCANILNNCLVSYFKAQKMVFNGVQGHELEN
jgi:hypothetical protein